MNYKMLTALLCGFVFSSITNAEISSRTKYAIPYEGVYVLNTMYQTPVELRPYPKLDRLVIFCNGSGQMHIALAQSSLSIPFIIFPEANYIIDPSNGHILINGIGGQQVYGQISLDIDPQTKTFTGYFTDELAEGYKELSGQALTTVSDFLDSTVLKPTAFQLTGSYKDVSGKQRLIIRTFSDGSITAAIRRQTATGDELYDTYGNSTYFQELGILTTRSTTPSRNGSVKKLTLVPCEENGKMIIKVQLLTTTGQSQVYQFVKTSEILFPKSWSSDASQKSLLERAAQIKNDLLAKVGNEEFQHFQNEMEENHLYSILENTNLNQGHSMFYIGYRADFIPQNSFLKFLNKHVELVRKQFASRGLNGYIVLATKNYEIAIMNWNSEAAMNAAFTEVGSVITEDADKFLKKLLWEKF